MDVIQTTCIKTQHSASVSPQASTDAVAAQAFAVATAQHSIATTTHASDTSAAVNNFSIEDRALKNLIIYLLLFLAPFHSPYLSPLSPYLFYIIFKNKICFFYGLTYSYNFYLNGKFQNPRNFLSEIMTFKRTLKWFMVRVANEIL
jgi:hypothetical protein